MINSWIKKTQNLNNLIFHSNQGWQYQMKQYRDKLLDKGIRQSMSRKGNCYDNYVIEIFFETLEDLEKAMHDYISYYNNQRIMTKLNGLTPITYRHQSINQVILN